jgi:hypothetical protein
MPIELDCPRCKHRLSVPSRKAGDYATCPRCQGRFWVPGPTPGQVPASAPPAGAIPMATPPVKRGASPAATPPIPNPQSPIPISAVEAPPVVALRRTARLVTTETTQSALKPAEDGKLPELQLREFGEAPAQKARSRGMNPLVLFGLLAVSLAATVLLVLMPTDGQDATTLREKQQARGIIQSEYFGGGTVPLEPYQRWLREAHQAHVRGDAKREQDLYKRVLSLLRVERSGSDQWLTGSPTSDEQLRQQIETLLSE